MVGEFIRKYLYLEEDCPAMLGNVIKPAQGKLRRNQANGMLKEINGIGSFLWEFSNFSNGNYCHGSLEVLQSYVGKTYEKIS